MTNQNKSTHGGKREGAGRPPSKIKRIRRNLSFTIEIWEKLGELAKEKELTRSLYIQMIIQETLTRRLEEVDERMD